MPVGSAIAACLNPNLTTDIPDKHQKLNVQTSAFIQPFLTSLYPIKHICTPVLLQKIYVCRWMSFFSDM